MTSSTFSVRWNTHQPNLVSYFGNLLSHESFVDVTLVSSEGKKIMCHKIILSSCSPYFQNVFESNPCKHPIVILKDVHYEDLKTIITFIYHGEVNISQDHINSILSTAASLQVKGLAEVPTTTGDKKGSGRKRDGEVQSRSLLTSNSSNSGENEDNGMTLQGTDKDIPRKKLKKSVTVSGSTSISTNGEPSGSFESGVGASINRSVDDSVGSNSAGGGSDNRINDGPSSTRISSLPSSLPIKSHSLDQLLDRNRNESVLVDSELSSGGFSENQTFDETETMGDERAGYEIDDLADVKIEADTDGEIEFEDDEEDESFGHDNPEFNELNQSNNPFPSIPSSSLNYQAVHHFASRVQGLKGRRLRPLLRQPRIKRDNEPGGELFIAESENVSGSVHGELEVDVDDHNSPSVPIVTVSQCSPTPPSSPRGSSPDPTTTCNSSINISTANSTTSTASPTSSSSLLMVPNMVETAVGSSKNSGSFFSGGAHLVKQISESALDDREREHSDESSQRKYLHESKKVIKQISQPALLPSHTTVLSTIRRQHSQPNPQLSGQQQQHIHVHQQGTRIIPLTSTTNPLNRGTFYHIVAADSSQSQSRDDQDSPATSGNAIILDSNSLIQLVPITHSKEDKKDQQQGDSERDESSEQKLTVHRASPVYERSDFTGPAHSHCPVLRPGPALGCNFCWNSVDECGRILRRKTKYHCPECHINLCIVPCFQDYHQEKVEKKKARLKTSKPSSIQENFSVTTHH